MDDSAGKRPEEQQRFGSGRRSSTDIRERADY
jgi:hypothetical protein